MRVSYKWLQDYVDIEISPEELAKKLTMAGIEIDEIEYSGKDISNVVVAKVLACEKHPGSKHLSICQVDDGKEKRTVICGAPNVAAGQTVPLALPGATLPGGKKITVAQVAGVESHGMICSAAELGIDESANAGIMVLPEELTLGQDIVEALGLDDAVLILELTPNRADCHGVLNVAREVAAITGKHFHQPVIQYSEKGPDINTLTKIEVQDPDLCPRYTGRLVQGVKIGPSPLWMQQYLRAAGMRPINNVVDISNFVLMETGQPLHTFDYQQLAGRQIIVRRARDGEMMTTLDKKDRILDKDNLMICDAGRPVCIAGVMGGLDTEVTEATKDVLIESAYFDPVSIRRTSRRFGLASEAASRFEKGLDIEGCDFASRRCAQLLVDLCGGTAARGMIDVSKHKYVKKQITLRIKRVNDILGTAYDRKEIAEVMQALAFPVEIKGDEITVGVPSYRLDITEEIDLIEEVARIRGYDTIKACLPNESGSCGQKTPKQKALDKLRLLCSAKGLREAVNYSFISPRDLDKLALSADHPWRQVLTIMNPLNEEQSIMRTSLLPGLLHTLEKNYSRRNLDLLLFEYGSCFFPKENDLPDEVPTLAIALSGKVPGGWNGADEALDYFYLKGLFEEIILELGAGACTFKAQNEEPYLHPGKSAAIFFQGQKIGIIGEVHPLVGEAFGLEKAAVVLEIALSAVFEAASVISKCRELPKYPAVTRDIALIGSNDIAAADIEAAIYQKGGPFLRRVELFDLYDKPPIPEGSRSLAFALSFQDYERTLTDSEINETISSIIDYLNEKWQLKLR